MYSIPDDNDFDVAATDISDRVIVIRDRKVVLTIEKWLSRLTTDENRGHNELDYLKLLQNMMANKRIGPPFHQNPPAGPLLPLGNYLLHSQQSVCEGPPAWCRNRAKCCRLISKNNGIIESQPTQQVDSEDNDDEDDEEQIAQDMNCKIIRKSNKNDFENVNRGCGAVLSTNDENKSYCKSEIAVTDENSKFSANDNGEVQLKHTERDGLHLAGGGGAECGPCSGGARASKKKIEPGKVCDPCLDSMGRHLKPPQPSPLDVAYRELLGDCALPVLTEAEQKSVNPGLLSVLKSVNDQITLQDFYFQVSQFTCDQASLLIKLSDSMMDDFRTFTSDVFESRTEHISDGLIKEQTALNVKYTYLTHRAFNRATIALDFLREALPLFCFSKYKTDPEAYMKRKILTAVPTVDAQKDGDGGGNGDDGADGGDGGHDENEKGAQQSAVKKLLYALNWLRAEVLRVDCEGQQLFEQRNRLTTSLADYNGQLSTAQCQAAVDIDRLKNELTLLRKKSSDQEANIDRLMEAIQVSMQSQTKSSDC
ncbi:Domain of unknown function DUF4485 [Cinara cedri]|uniref:DUF4485 domain-containing protein n=1 Tax=Cinara cedri TaxID=506608 RepID=A0A5E4NGA2_9HEMI|nr:Domain of unknown function DUF4485 [Cinara cedri]